MESYEQKYKEALKRCKKEFNFNNLAYSHEQIKQKLEHIFPELKESEDEKIKTNIIKLLRFVRDTYHQYSNECTEAIDWLEKQGKQEPISKCKTQFVEQKPVEWSKEDEKYYHAALWYIENSCGMCGCVYNWLKSIKSRLKGKEI